MAVLWDIRVGPAYKRTGIGTALFRRAVAFADIFFGLRGGVVRAIGRAAFFLVVALTTLREADFLVGLATEESNSFRAQARTASSSARVG